MRDKMSKRTLTAFSFFIFFLFYLVPLVNATDLCSSGTCYKDTSYANPWPFEDTVCPSPWCSSNCPLTRVCVNTCCYNRNCYRSCGTFTCWCICEHSEDTSKPSCGSYCGSGGWFHNGNAVCKNVVGWDCDYDFDLCLASGCCDPTCNAATGCGTTPDDTECSDNSCSQTHNDYCSSKRLVEYDNDCVDDSTTVTDSCSNTCQSGCTCTNCPVDCSAPPTTTHCCYNEGTGTGECGAECDSDGDCASGYTCNSNCECVSTCTNDCSVCSDCGGGADCKTYGSCGGFSSTCDETGTRAVTTYTCADTDADPCLDCSSSQSSGSCTRDTDGDPCGTTPCPSAYCSDSTNYTYPATCTRTCSGGSCQPSCTCSATPIDCSASGNWDGDAITCNCDCDGFDVVESEANGNCNDGKDNDCDGNPDSSDPDCPSDQCDLDSDCDDGEYCTNDWCERPADPDSVCHNDPVTDGTDCGDCRECQTGVCTYLCTGAESSCECISDSCIDCSNYYGTACGYGSCNDDQRPSWDCVGGACSVSSCNVDPTCVCAPPASGDWIIDQVCDLDSETHTVNGNLIIQSTGQLIMRGTTNIIFAGAGRKIYIYSGGKIYIYDTAGFNK